MVQFNAFAIHDLVAFGLTYALAVVFYMVYWTRGRKVQDLLFANLVATAAASCLMIFLAADEVSSQVKAATVKRGPENTLLWMRLLYVFGLVGLVCLLHFVLRYSHSRTWLSRHIGWAYVALLVFAPTIWSDWFLKMRTVAQVEADSTSSWTNCMPYMPHVGWLVVPYLVLWLGIHVYCQIVLWHYDVSGRCPENLTTRLGLIRLALVMMAGGMLIDVVAAAFLNHSGISFIPFFSVLMGVFAGGALLQDHAAARRVRQTSAVGAG